MVALGGRAAEIVLYNKDGKDNKKQRYNDRSIFEDIDNLDITTGASSDLNQATQIARNYVNLFGIDDEYVLYDNNNPSQPFMGREIGMNTNKVSEISKARVDQEIERIINFCYRQTLNIIEQNKEPLKDIADNLMLNTVVNKTMIDSLDIYYS
jgi:cell division protease FtsH